MVDNVKLHFGYSKSKNYGQSTLLSSQAKSHIVKGTGINQWHTVEFDENSPEQLNLAANILRLTINSTYPKIHGADIRKVYNCAANNGKYMKTTTYKYAVNGKQAERALQKILNEQKKPYAIVAAELNKIIEDIKYDTAKAKDVLSDNGYIETQYNGILVTYTDKIKPVVPQEFSIIKELVAQKNYTKAIQAYHDYFKSKIIKNDVFTNELIFLKREAGIQPDALELVALYGVAKSNKIVIQHYERFLDCVNEQIKIREKESLPTPLEVLTDQLPTVEQMIQARKDDWHKKVFFSDGKIKRDHTPVSGWSFSVEYDKCLQGNIYDMFPDPVRRSEILEIPESTHYWQLWTYVSQKTYEQEVTNKGLHLGHIDCVDPKIRGYHLVRGDQIKEFRKNEQIHFSPVGGSDVKYTGRTHRVGLKRYYEINVIRKDINRTKKLGNAFTQLIEEILRDAENDLRAELGLPKIGEGWISEMEMYRLVKTLFPDAKHHARPDWLKPQHLDVFVKSEKLAFEYQGKQHYEPVKYFGGEQSLLNTQRLDKQKRRLCKKNSVRLIYWDYIEPLTLEVLNSKLDKVAV